MNMILLAVFDVVVGAYVGTPIGAPTRGAGERSFVDAVNDPKSPFAAHPDDYELHELGSFDMSTGRLEAVEPRPVVYGRARAFLNGGGQ